jgi:hypothetical protein
MFGRLFILLESWLGIEFFESLVGLIYSLDIYVFESLFGTCILSSELSLSAPAMIDSSVQQAMPFVPHGAQDLLI